MPEVARPMNVPARTPMDQFAVDDNERIVGGQHLSFPTEHVGRTPFYAYDRAGSTAGSPSCAQHSLRQ